MPTGTHHPGKNRDQVRQEAMTAAIIRRANNGQGTTSRDLAACGFSQAEVARLGADAVAEANRQLAKSGRAESWLDLPNVA
jgi:hypothetical protein